jgi:hypothetical protein
MRDYEFIFSSVQLTEIAKTGLFIKVTSKNKDSTFTVSLTGRNADAAV